MQDTKQLREKIGNILADACYNFDTDDYFSGVEEIKEDEVYKDSLKELIEVFATQRKEILEEVRSIIGDDEEAFEETVSLDLGGYNDPEITKNVGYKTRNKFRAEQRQKLSLLGGNNAHTTKE